MSIEISHESNHSGGAESKLRKAVADVGNSIFAKNKDGMREIGFTDTELDSLVEEGWLEFDESVTKTYSPTDKFYATKK